MSVRHIAALVIALITIPTMGLAQDPGQAAPMPTGNEQPVTAPQAPLARAAIYGELLGNGGFYTLNFDYRIIEDLSVRAGLGFIAIQASSGSSSSKSSVLSIPIMANYLGVGNDRHHLELGAGLILVYASASASSSGTVASGSGFGVGGTVTTGYRFQPNDGGFVFRAGFTPWFGRGGFQAWGGVSFGYAF